MASNSLFGQGSGDFRETSARLQLFHVVTRNSMGAACPDAFTQMNPPVITSTPNKSSTLTNVLKYGVLSGSVAFTRPDAGNNLYGGPTSDTVTYDAKQKPLGLFVNDIAGNAFENLPGAASGRNTYVHGTGTCVGVTLYETKQQIGGSAALTYGPGDILYASVNGYLTNRLADAYEYNVAGQNDIKFVTPIGIVKVAPDATTSLLVLDMRI